MAIFPPHAANYTDPVYDAWMNYGNGSLLILISIVALFLNAIVFHANVTQLRPGTVSGCFMVLSASDFLYTLIRPPYIIYNLINPNVSSEEVNEKPPKPGREVVSSGAANMLCYISISVIFGISILRFVKLGYPLWAASHRVAVQVIALVSMAITALFSAALEVALLSGCFEGYRWTSTAEDVIARYKSLMILKLWTVFVPAALSLILALATIIKLRNHQSSEMNKYSMVTILLLSVGNMPWIAQWIATAALGEAYFFNETKGSIKGQSFVLFFFYAMMPSLVALYNPLILCIRSSKMRATLRRIFMGVNVTGYQTLQ